MSVPAKSTIYYHYDGHSTYNYERIHSWGVKIRKPLIVESYSEVWGQHTVVSQRRKKWILRPLGDKQDFIRRSITELVLFNI